MLGRIQRLCDAMLCQAGKGHQFFIDHAMKTIGQMVAMGTMNGDAFDAFAMIFAGFFAGTMIFACVMFVKFFDKFILNFQAFFSVACAEGFHGSFFNFIMIDFHENSLSELLNEVQA